jgi:hypothetical protein
VYLATLAAGARYESATNRQGGGIAKVSLGIAAVLPLARTFCLRLLPGSPFRRPQSHPRQPPPEESADSEKFNCTPGAILPINEDERLDAHRAGKHRRGSRDVPTRGDVRRKDVQRDL